MKINKLLIFIVTGLIFISFVSCSKKVVEKTEYKITEDVLSYDIPVDNLVVIKLEKNATTGYTWHYFIDDESILSFNSELTDATKTDPTIVGAPIVHTWKFKTLKPGTTALKFAYVRDWEAKAIELKNKLDDKFPKLKEWNARLEASIKKYEFTINVK
jgi:predicted secreted protein